MRPRPAMSTGRSRRGSPRCCRRQTQPGSGKRTHHAPRDARRCASASACRHRKTSCTWTMRSSGSLRNARGTCRRCTLASPRPLIVHPIYAPPTHSVAPISNRGPPLECLAPTSNCIGSNTRRTLVWVVILDSVVPVRANNYEKTCNPRLFPNGNFQIARLHTCISNTTNDWSRCC